VRKRNRIISLLLVTLFGLLVLKNLAPTLIVSENCDEFGHIHMNKYYAVSKRPVISAQSSLGGLADDECHSGKSVFAYSLFPKEVFYFEPEAFKISFDKVFVLKNFFKSPYLEPLRKPPKAA